MKTKRILDACCGSRMFWFDKTNQDVVFMDNRNFSDTLCDGRKLVVNPDIVGDFTKIPFPDSTFFLVVFDPPHLIKVGEKSWLAKKYGRLEGNWKTLIKDGFDECLRVLKNNGTLIFKWNERDISIKEILSIIEHEPLFGHTTKNGGQTIWMAFMK